MKSSLTSEARDVPVPVVSTDPKSTTRKDTRRSSTVCVWGTQSIVCEYQYYFIGSLEIYARSLRGTLNMSAGLWIGQYCSCIHPLLSLSNVAREFLRIQFDSIPHDQLRQISVEKFHCLIAANFTLQIWPPRFLIHKRLPRCEEFHFSDSLHSLRQMRFNQWGMINLNIRKLMKFLNFCFLGFPMLTLISHGLNLVIFVSCLCNSQNFDHKPTTNQYSNSHQSLTIRRKWHGFWTDWLESLPQQPLAVQLQTGFRVVTKQSFS